MPPKRDEAALQEEEELQLAIALSQSEAEEKERMVSFHHWMILYLDVFGFCKIHVIRPDEIPLLWKAPYCI